MINQEMHQNKLAIFYNTGYRKVYWHYFTYTSKGHATKVQVIQVEAYPVVVFDDYDPVHLFLCIFRFHNVQQFMLQIYVFKMHRHCSNI